MSLQSPLAPKLPQHAFNQLQWGGLTGSVTGLIVSQLMLDCKRPLLLICPDNQSMNKLYYELKFFLNNKTDYLLPLPDWETLPYDHFSPHHDITSERLKTLRRLPELKQGILLTSLPTLQHKLLPSSFIKQHVHLWKVEQHFDLDQQKQILIEAGYQSVNEVMSHGEFAVRGAIVDIFPMGSQTPYRIDLFDNEIDSIRSFDPENQRSLNKYETVEILPAFEFPMNKEGINQFREQWRETFDGNPKDSFIYNAISQGGSVAGIEYYLPLFYPKLHTIADYLPDNTLILLQEHLADAGDHFWEEIQKRYEELAHDRMRPILPPSQLFLNTEQIFTVLKPFHQIKLFTNPVENKQGHENFAAEPLPSLIINHRANEPMAPLLKYLENKPHRILFCAETMGRREVLLDLLHKNHMTVKTYETWQTFVADDCYYGIVVGGLDHGLICNQPDLLILTEAELFGEPVMQRRLRKKREHDPSQIIRSLTELEIGSPVVHLQHGVGRYQGLQLIDTGDYEAEYLSILYADDAKIYVPVHDLHLIARYTGIDNEHAPLHKLGSQQWSKAKARAQQKIHDVAAELLAIYAKREANPGFQYPTPSEDYQNFRRNFRFEETVDQEQTIASIINDMTSSKSMDRVVCGDVGFGKTEVAMRAAFIAADSGKQVAILVPTTLLCIQHWQSFKDRFADWPFHIEFFSRLKTPKEVAAILKGLESGSIDIIIGTHKLLSDNIKFKDLGLLIVDEEHRFGVRQKERIKQLRANVDILTLTATPIPRTLNMALSGTRDLSLITTPPAKRLAVKTFIEEKRNSLIREAVMREIMRGGQIYFLHNNVKTIEKTTADLQKLIPECRITYAHGQMPKRQMEKIMADFYHQRFNVLVATTIIESGIDIPTANTMIIDQANHFGLSQIHQLRGRVGRSHHQAYAYLLVNSKKALQGDAAKRLDAIAEMNELGAGFNLASHDLEIRGAGELLGDEQSGHIEAIGFSLYMDLLEKAVKALKKGEEPPSIDYETKGPEIDLQISALIPETYIFDVNMRLQFYKKLSDCESDADINDIKTELIDRYGLLPEVTKNLLAKTHLKLLAQKMGIKKITLSKQFGYLEFNENPEVDPVKIIKLIQLQPKIYQLQGSHKLRFSHVAKNDDERLKAVNTTIQQLKN